MSRKTRRIKRAARRQQKNAEFRSLIAQVDALVRPLGCRISGVGPCAVGVQGDARTYGVSVVIRFPQDATPQQAIDLSTLITNRVSRVTRVLRDL